MINKFEAKSAEKIKEFITENVNKDLNQIAEILKKLEDITLGANSVFQQDITLEDKKLYTTWIKMEADLLLKQIDFTVQNSLFLGKKLGDKIKLITPRDENLQKCVEDNVELELVTDKMSLSSYDVLDQENTLKLLNSTAEYLKETEIKFKESINEMPIQSFIGSFFQTLKIGEVFSAEPHENTKVVGLKEANSVLSIMGDNLQQIWYILLDLLTLASKSNSGVNGSEELLNIKSQMDELLGKIDQIVDQTSYNETKLIDGTYTAKHFQTGFESTNIIDVDFPNSVTTAGLGIESIDVTKDVVGAFNAVEAAIGILNNARASIGALHSNFSYALTHFEVYEANTAMAKSICNNLKYDNNFEQEDALSSCITEICEEYFS